MGAATVVWGTDAAAAAAAMATGDIMLVGRDVMGETEDTGETVFTGGGGEAGGGEDTVVATDRV